MCHTYYVKVYEYGNGQVSCSKECDIAVTLSHDAIQMIFHIMFVTISMSHKLWHDIITFGGVSLKLLTGAIH